MNNIHYCVIDQNEDRVLARDMSLHDALLFIQALFERYSLPDNVAYTIKQQEDDKTEAPAPNED